MPELYGKPFKYELRAQIRELDVEFRRERDARIKAERSLEYARSRIEELEAKIERMQQQAEAIVAESKRDVDAETFERMKKRRQERFDAIFNEVAKEQAH